MKWPWHRRRREQERQMAERVRAQPDLVEIRQSLRDTERQILELELDLQHDILHRRRRSSMEYHGPDRRKPT